MAQKELVRVKKLLARVPRESADEVDVDALQRRIVRVETLLIFLTIGAIAVADFVVGTRISLGPLYLIPLSYSALTHRGMTTVALFLVCLTLRQWLGPIQDSEDPWFFFVRDLGIAAVFIATVGYLHRLGRQKTRFFDVARRQRDDLSREVEMAAGLQRRLLDLNEAPAGELDIEARTEPLKGVGGDYYDFVDLGSGRTGVVIADVAGKGLRAALLMTAVRIALRSIVQRKDDPEQILAELNDVLYQSTEASNYATLFFASIDTRSGSLVYVNAGHVPALLVGPSGEMSWLAEGGPPVGLLPDATFENRHALLAPSGALVLCSDGVTEAENGDGEELGTEGLARIVSANLESRSSAASLVSALHAELKSFLASGVPKDDTTWIVIRRPVS